MRGPAQSRVDLLADAAGVAPRPVGDLERLNRIDPLEVFTAFDGPVVEAGDLVASVKVAPHVVAESRRRARPSARLGSARRPLVRVAPFRPERVGVVVKESLRAAARERFERASGPRSRGSARRSIGDRLRRGRRRRRDGGACGRCGRGPGPVDLVLTAGGRSTDPLDPFFVAIERLGGRVVRHGVPAHPGSMLWLARIGRTASSACRRAAPTRRRPPPTCCCRGCCPASAASARTVARLGHGGILTRDQRFRFPAYARELDAPEG